jgi:hypothetical protein
MLCHFFTDHPFWGTLLFLAFVQALAIVHQIACGGLISPFLMSEADLQKTVQLMLVQAGERAEEVALTFAYRHLKKYRLAEYTHWRRTAREIRRQKQKWRP